MNEYVACLNCKISANNAEEAKAQALVNLQIREASPTITMPLNVYERLKSIRGKTKEHLVVFLLNTQQEILRQELVSLGILDMSVVHAREVYRPAIAEGCASVILAHNHPSGSTSPSDEDLSITRRLVKAGEIIGIKLLDHIIVSRQGYYSLKEHGQM
jgi:DNA repair protein RadC